MTCTWKILQTKDTKRDRADIVRWTIRHFGTRQAAIYSETIALALAALCDGPDTLGIKRRDDLAPGILTLHVARDGRKGRHFIVFRIRDECCIEVLRLLHDSMDLTSHLPV